MPCMIYIHSFDADLSLQRLPLKLSVLFALCQTISIIIHPCHNISHLSQASHWSVSSLPSLWLADQCHSQHPSGPKIDGMKQGTGENFHNSHTSCDLIINTLIFFAKLVTLYHNNPCQLWKTESYLLYISLQHQNCQSLACWEWTWLYLRC